MIGAFTLFCGFILLIGWLYLLRDWWASVRWLSVPAIVRGVVVEPAQNQDPLRPWREREGFRPVVRYAYEVGDQTYLGTRFSAIREPVMETEDAANAFLTRFPLGGRLMVRVHPQQPKISLISRELSLMDALPGYLALGCLLIGVLIV